MSDFFNNAIAAIKTTISARAPFGSSTGHRNAQRSNAATEVISSSLETFTPAAMIPTKLAQVAISTYSFFRSDTHISEKAMHLLQAGISAAQMGLAITMLFESAQCSSYDSNDLCKAVFLCQLLYRGTLLTGWIPSEFSKDTYTSADNSNNSAQAQV
ncbi:hypothetical protein [Legionella drancourtii]|uniref:Uncharacterized protein n=1 Tax=Legionella drancourtii LLAP12 TaxID=658187 RepID=G9EKJ9_9GAMM|nr:hypothetical protein [Legionella drancourtii]EHL32350.1 hypothetical protein LDG_5734 [Legionella drancourtii LLAP12]